MDDTRNRGAAIAALIAIVVLYLAMLGSYGLMEPDEGRYAEIPREMMEAGDYITPRLNYVKYFEKPPMLYWMVSASFAAFGQNEFAARLPGALCALACAGVAWALGRRMFGRTAGLLGGIVTATSLLHFGVGRIVLTDMPLTLFMTAAVAAHWYAMTAESAGERRASAAIFWASMALGTLTKGLVANVLPCGAVVLYALLTRSTRGIRAELSPIGIALFAAIAVPYFYTVCKVNPEFFDFFFIREHFLRYTTTVHNRYEPVWFFLPLLPAGMMPWTGWLPSIFARGSALRDARTRGAAGYLLMWCALVLGFFSMSSSKLIPYIAPCVPPLAVLIGAELTSMIERARWHRPSLICASVINVLMAAALVIFASQGRYIAPSEVMPAAVAAALSLVVGVAAMLFMPRRTSHAKAAAVICVTAMLFFASLTDVWLNLGESRSMKGVASALEGERGRATVASWHEVLQGLSFYGRTRVLVVGGAGELDFGYEREAIERPDAEPYLLSREDFTREWGDGRPFALVIRTDDIEGSGLAHVRSRDLGKYSIIFNYGGDER